MKAIESYILGCTAKLPTRIKATCHGEQITIPYPSEVYKACGGPAYDSDAAAHHYVVNLLIEKLGWRLGRTTITGFGQLGNGHFVWTLGPIELPLGY